jgi:hypothetical protein
MGYGRGYGRRGYSSRPRQFSDGRVERVNRRPGPCHYCGDEVAAGAGQLFRETDGSWSAVHGPQAWSGSPVSGFYIGGCPDDTDKMNREGGFGGPGLRPERDRLAAVAAAYAATHPAEPARASRGYAWTSGGARMSNRYRRCEDAPCCGCCD